MKTNKIKQVIAAITIFISLGLLVQSCTKDSGEDLTVTIVGSYQFQLMEDGNVTNIGIPTVISKVNNNTIKIAITGKETVNATIGKLKIATAFSADVQDQTDITNGKGGDCGGGAINIGFDKKVTSKTIRYQYYGEKK